MLNKFLSKSKVNKIILVGLAGMLTLSLGNQQVSAAQYIFPVVGNSNFGNDFNGHRASGNHNAIDIFADKHQTIVSASDGTITFVGYPQPSWGYAVFIESPSGYTYRYIHLNNDAPGTDNGYGNAMQAYAPDVKVGNPVVRGQAIGKIGDSGNAENTPSHLHFEVTTPDGTPHNPYNSLLSAQKISRSVSNYPTLSDEVVPYGSGYRRSVNLAIGDVNGDMIEETVVAAGDGGGPRVQFYNLSKELLYEFYAFDSSWRRGADIAVGDVNGDGQNELIVGTISPSGPLVATYAIDLASKTATKLNEFSVFGTHDGGIQLASGDLDGNGVDEIIAAAGKGGGPRVSIFNNTGNVIKSFYAYDLSFKGGADVSTGDVSGTTVEELVVGPMTRGSSKIQVYSAMSETPDTTFYAYDAGYRGGVRVSVGNVIPQTTKEEIITVPDNGGGPTINYLSATGSKLHTFRFMEEWWRGGYDVAAGENQLRASTGIDRRGSVRFLK